MEQAYNNALQIIREDANLLTILRDKKRQKDTDFNFAKGKVFAYLHKEYLGWGFLAALECDLNVGKGAIDLDFHNVFQYSAQNELTIEISPGMLKLIEAETKKEVAYPIRNHIPIIATENQRRKFEDVRASLEVASYKIGENNDPLNVSKLADAQATLSKSSYTQFAKLTAPIPNPLPVCIDSAYTIYKEHFEPREDTVLQKKIHSSLIVDYAKLVEKTVKPTEVKEYVQIVKGQLEETKKKLVPKDTGMVTQPIASKTLNAGRSLRGKDCNGLSGYSMGHNHNMLMRKEDNDMLDELVMLGNLRTLHKGKVLWVSGHKHSTSLYAPTNIAGPICYVGNVVEQMKSPKVLGEHERVDVQATPPRDAIRIDMASTSHTFKDSVPIEDRIIAFDKWFTWKDDVVIKYKKTNFIYNPVAYRVGEDGKREPYGYYEVLTYKSLHNMWCLVSNRIIDKPHFSESTLFYRMSLVNYMRNNWAHCASSVTSVLGKQEKILTVCPPYTTKEKKMAIAYDYLESNEQVLEEVQVEVKKSMFDDIDINVVDSKKLPPPTKRAPLQISSEFGKSDDSGKAKEIVQAKDPVKRQSVVTTTTSSGSVDVEGAQVSAFGFGSSNWDLDTEEDDD